MALNLTSRIALLAAKSLSRGYWPILRAAARLDPNLQDYALPLTGIPGYGMRADFRKSVYLPLLRQGCIPHQRGLDALCRNCVAPGDTAIDVGANVGYVALLLSSLVGGTGKVFAFEPSRRIFRQLSRTVEQIGNIVPINLAVGEGAGSATFYDTEYSDISSLAPIDGAETYSVGVTSLDIFCPGKNVAPSFIKVDVEGLEPSVFRGMRDLLGAERPPIVVFEALTAERREDSLHELPGSFVSESVVYRVGDTGITRHLDATTLSSDYVIVPKWAAARTSELIIDH